MKYLILFFLLLTTSLASPQVYDPIYDNLPVIKQQDTTDYTYRNTDFNYRFMRYKMEKKDPLAAGLLSLLLPGLGQLYNDEESKFFLLNVAEVGALTLIILNPNERIFWVLPGVIHSFAIADAVRSATQYNKSLRARYFLSHKSQKLLLTFSF